MSQQYIIFNFSKSNTVLKLLFAFIAVNKDLEEVLHLREKEVLSGTILLENSEVLAVTL